MIPSISQTPSNTPSNTATVTPSGSACPPTPSPSITATRTPTVTPTNTPTITQTNTATLTITPTRTVTPTITSSNTPTNTVTPTITPSLTPSITPTITPTQTCPIITQYLRAALLTPLEVQVDVWGDSGFTISQNAYCNYRANVVLASNLGSLQTRNQYWVSTGNHSGTYTFNPWTLPGEITITTYITTPSPSTSGCTCPVILIDPYAPTPSPTNTPTVTPTTTLTVSATPTLTPTRTSTATPTNTPTVTITISPSISVSPSITPTNTPTRTVTPTSTVTPTITPSRTSGLQVYEYWTTINGFDFVSEACASGQTCERILYSTDNPLTSSPVRSVMYVDAALTTPYNGNAKRFAMSLNCSGPWRASQITTIGELFSIADCGAPTPTPSITPTITMTPSITPTITMTPTPSSVALDPDASAYLAQVLAQGGTGITPTISAATDTMFVSLKSAGLYTKLQAFYPYLGGVANSHSINAKTIGTFTVAWSGTITHNSQGVRGNGSSGIGTTGWIQSANTTVGNTTIGCYIVASGNTGWDMGIVGSTTHLGFNSNGSGGTLFLGRMGNTSNVGYIATNYQTGFYATSRTGTTNIDFIRFSGSSSSVASTEGGLVNLPMGLLNFAGSGFPSSKTYGTHFMGTGMNGTDLANMRNIITTFNNAIGR